MNPATQSHRDEFWEETLENLQEAARIIESTRAEVLEYDKDYYTIGAVFGLRSQSQYLLDKARTITSDIFCILGVTE